MTAQALDYQVFLLDRITTGSKHDLEPRRVLSLVGSFQVGDVVTEIHNDGLNVGLVLENGFFDACQSAGGLLNRSADRQVNLEGEFALVHFR